jgi:putative ABC transport system permease protein
VPVGFGDFVGRYPIVGVTRDAIDMLGGLAEGESLQHLGDALAGSQVARDIGSTFRPFHGVTGTPGEVHEHAQYHVVGRLKPTGTPWDRALLVPIQSVWDVHADHDHEDHAGTHEGEAHAEHEHEHVHDHDHDHDHGHETEFGAEPIDDARLENADNPGVPAIVVKPKTIADAYNLRQEYRRGNTLAVFPAEVLTQLYGTLGDARSILLVIAAGAQALVGAAILMQIATHVLQRRRQIGALRAFGASRPVVLTIVWLEVFFILACGLLLGFAMGYGAAVLISERLGQMSGVALPVLFQRSDLWSLLAFLGIAALATLLPALIAYRQTPAQALRS